MKKVVCSVLLLGSSVFAIDIGGIGSAILQNAASSAVNSATQPAVANTGDTNALIAKLAEYQKALEECKASSGVGGVSKADSLKELAELKKQGILTEAEFDAEKKKILGN